MSTMEAIAYGWREARRAARAGREARSGTSSRGRLGTAVMEHGLTFLGLSCFVAAAVMVAIPLGLLVAGAGLFILEWRVSQ